MHGSYTKMHGYYNTKNTCYMFQLNCLHMGADNILLKFRAINLLPHLLTTRCSVLL